MRIELKDLLPSQDFIIQFRSLDVNGLPSGWSQGYRFTTDGDTTAPAVPDGLGFAAAGSSFAATWNKVTLDGDGGPLKDFKDYEVTISNVADTITKIYYTAATSFEFTQSLNLQVFGDPPAYQVKINVRSRDITGNRSSPVTATALMDTPPVPSTPTVTVVQGQLIIGWNGEPATGTRNDFNLNHVEIHASTTNNFAPSDATRVGRFEGMFPGPQTQPVSGFAYGSPVYVKLIAVNRVGRKSTPSAQASGTPVRITGLDIENGQISAAQINFTARDIGGANAYFPATTVARDALTGVKNGDIAYVTGSGYATYRYNGTTWVSAPEIGVVSGTKILTGTLTSDAVGTNLLIANSANIANGIIDNAKISGLDAGKITTGTIQSSSTVTYGGGPARPAWQLTLNGDAFLNNVSVRGQIVFGNSGDTLAMNTAAVARSYDYLAGTAGWAIKGDGTVEFNNGMFRGNISGGTITGAIYQTATTGRRIVIAPTSSVGSMQFIAADGTVAQIKTVTVGTLEVFRFGIDIVGSTDLYWNSWGVTENEALFGYARNIHLAFGGVPGAADSIQMFFKRDKGTGLNNLRGQISENSILFSYNTTGNFAIIEDLDPTTSNIEFLYRMYQTSDGTTFYQSANASGFIVNQFSTVPAVQGQEFYRLWADGDGNFRSSFIANRNWFITENASGTLYNRFVISTEQYGFYWANSAPATWLERSPTSDRGPLYHSVNSGNWGFTMFWRSTTAGASPRVEFQDAAMSGTYVPIFASAFVPSSSIEVKTSIKNLESGAKDKILSLQAKKYKRKGHHTAEGDIVAEPGPDEIGFLAEEMIEEAQVLDQDGKVFGVDLYQLLTLEIAAHQETIRDHGILESKVEELAQKIEQLIKKNKEK